MNTHNKSLKGVTVLDISRLLPRGYASLLLCEMGVRVIKVEAPGVGDYHRGVIPGGLLESHTRVIHQGKESLTLDLKVVSDQKIFLKLVKKSDVIIESFRPGILDKMGLGFKKLQKVNPKIILCSITGFGQKGSKSHMAGHDMNFVGLSGLFHKMRDRSGLPVLPDFQIADMAVGMEAAMKISAALVEREKRKKGRRLIVRC
ncbi:MAG: CoA transferase [Deltaproteobacteria bacterium]|nr:MAG: CoA transferase [Deltaproteobacteria bacterium]